MPKQLLTIGGTPILQRSLELFAGHPRVDRIVVVLPPDLAREPAGVPGRPRAAGDASSRAARGARTRWRTASRVIRDDVDLVIVHDAARPFASAGLVDRDDRRGRGRPGRALAALPASDTVKLAPDGVGGAAHVPSSGRFRGSACSWRRRRRRSGREVLAAAIAAGEGLAAATDEAALAEAARLPGADCDGRNDEPEDHDA